LSQEIFVVATAPPRYRRTGLPTPDLELRPLIRLSQVLNTIAGLGALALIALVIGLALYAIGHQGRIYQGVSVAGIDVSGLTEAEAEEAIRRDYSIYMNTPLTLSHNGASYAISPNELGLRIDAQASVEQAMEFGRDGSLWSRSRDWAEGLFGGADVSAVVVADTSRTDEGLLALTEDVAHPPTNASIDFSGEAAVIVPEVPGIGYDYGTTKVRVLDRVSSRSYASVEIATTVVQPDVTADKVAATLPSAETALGNALVLRGLDGQRWTLDSAQLKSIISIRPDGSGIQVDREALKRLVNGIAESVNQDPTDAALFVNGEGLIEMVPAIRSIEVDSDQSVKMIEDKLLAGEHEVELTIERKLPKITDERAQGAMDQMIADLASGIKVKWDGGDKQLSSADLISALVIHSTPDEEEAFTFTLSPEVLSGLIQTFAGDIEVEPQEATFRLINGEIRAEKKGRTGIVINYEDSAKRIEKAVFDGYPSSNLKVDIIEPEFNTGDADEIALPDVLADAATPYSSSSEARKTNVERGVELENGWLIAPGDEFSYIEYIGSVTKENGFEVGLGIVADPENPGQVVTAPVIGGGICQVSTTIFQAAFWAGLTFTERHQHPYWINSYGVGDGGMKGLDAMVNIEDEPSEWAITLDLKFVNMTGNWIAVEMFADGENVTARILGTDPGWSIEVEDPEISNVTKPNSTPIKQESPEVPAGEERQVETAQDGFDAEVERTVTDKEGTILDTYVVSSTYSATSNRILVGTGR
jgi:vancomycin resistance protein YoaR